VIWPRQEAVPAQWPNSYIALGDSYASGIGAGKYVPPADGEIKRCKRFDGSYPSQLKAMLGQVPDEKFDFVACSGNQLQHLPAQFEKLGDKRAQLVTLSISGNDFYFGPVVENCIYNYTSYVFSDTRLEVPCQEILQVATERVFGNEVFEEYKAAVRKILDERLLPDDVSSAAKSVLVITGYAKFFPTPKQGDRCSEYRFPLTPALETIFKTNKLKFGTRQQMNELVDLVNERIRKEIVTLSDRIQFVDIDAGFEGHRFCEKNHDREPEGANDPDVWFTSINTKLEEDSFVPNPDSELERSWDEWSKRAAAEAGQGGGDGDEGDLFPGIPNELRKSSVFHPKTAGHAKTAAVTKDTLDKWAAANPLPVIVPVTDFPDNQPGIIPVLPMPEPVQPMPPVEKPRPPFEPIPKPGQNPCFEHGTNICI
jgi:hypothetical protein